jgi:hypothetical protein
VFQFNKELTALRGRHLFILRWQQIVPSLGSVAVNQCTQWQMGNTDKGRIRQFTTQTIFLDHDGECFCSCGEREFKLLKKERSLGFVDGGRANARRVVEEHHCVVVTLFTETSCFAHFQHHTLFDAQLSRSVLHLRVGESLNYSAYVLDPTR